MGNGARLQVSASKSGAAKTTAALIDSDSDSGDKGCPLPSFLQKRCGEGDNKKDWTKIFADWKCSTCDKWRPVSRDKCYAKWC